MSRPRSIYIVSMLSVFHFHLHFHFCFLQILVLLVIFKMCPVILNANVDEECEQLSNSKSSASGWFLIFCQI